MHDAEPMCVNLYMRMHSVSITIPSVLIDVPVHFFTLYTSTSTLARLFNATQHIDCSLCLRWHLCTNCRRVSCWLRLSGCVAQHLCIDWYVGATQLTDFGRQELNMHLEHCYSLPALLKLSISQRDQLLQSAYLVCFLLSRPPGALSVVEFSTKLLCFRLQHFLLCIPWVSATCACMLALHVDVCAS